MDQATHNKIVSFIWGIAGWGSMVREGKYRDGRFAEELVHACANLVREWNPQPFPAWVCCVPSLRHPELVPDFARRLAQALNLPFHDVLKKTDHRPPQKEMNNSTQQARNVDGSLSADNLPDGCDGPVLLVDDMVDSRWTLTVAAWLLRTHGCGQVWPLALARPHTRFKFPPRLWSRQPSKQWSLPRQYIQPRPPKHCS